jgi:hypothetical protein
MTSRTDIQRKIDQAMDSILGIMPATPAPFFYTRLEARLAREDDSVWIRAGSLITRPAFVLLTVLIVLMLNVFVAINETDVMSTQSDGNEMATADDLGTNAFYDIENVQP